jgi:glycine cleavage system H protein
VSELYSPLSGEIIEINKDLAGSPETINSDPFGAGWLFKVRYSEITGLLSSTEYDALVGEA